jgi:hypothetical protein
VRGARSFRHYGEPTSQLSHPPSHFVSARQAAAAGAPAVTLGHRSGQKICDRSGRNRSRGSAASSAVNTSGNLSSSSWGLCLAEPSASLGRRVSEFAVLICPFPSDRNHGVTSCTRPAAAWLRRPYPRLVPPRTPPSRTWPSPSSQKRCHWAHKPLTCG